MLPTYAPGCSSIEHIQNTFGSGTETNQPTNQPTPRRWEVTPTGPNHRLLQEDPRTGSIVAVYDAGGPGSSATTHGAIRPLERQSRHMNFFSDELWVPSVLEFFMQVRHISAMLCGL